MKKLFLGTILLYFLCACHFETGGSYDFMITEYNIFNLLMKNWWLFVNVILIFVLVSIVNKKNDTLFNI